MLRDRQPLHILQLILIATTVAIGGALLVFGVGIGNPWAVFGLACVAAVAERGRVKLGGISEASISLLPTVFAAAVFGPSAGMLVAAISFIGDAPALMSRSGRAAASDRGAPWLKWGIYTNIRAIYGAAAGAAAAGVHLLHLGGVGNILLATGIAALVAEPLDVAFATITLKLRGGDPMAFLKMFSPLVAASVSLYTPIVALLALAYVELSPWTLAFFFLPALAAQRLFGLYQQQRELAESLGEMNDRLESANLSFATALVATLDARDQYTAGHSAAVAVYARDIATRMGLTDKDQQCAHLAGLVHDIGKIGLPAGLLEKPGALTLEERRVMQSHAEIGCGILSKVDTYEHVAAIVRSHHERIDGNGYPDGLVGDQIPLLARIIAVADAYNAMTSHRPYRDAMKSRVARLRLAQAAETQFDTSVLAAFEAILAGATEDYRTARGGEFWLLTSAVPVFAEESSSNLQAELATA